MIIMNKKLIFCFAIALAIVNFRTLYAIDPPAGKIKNYHINQNFDKIDVLPAGWSYNSGTAALVSRNWADGVIDVENKNFKISQTAAQNQTLGGDLIFPSPQSNETFQSETKFYLEVDWNPVTVNVDAYRRANLFLVSGSGSKNLRTDASYYIDAILGLYTCDNEYIYYCNQDLPGPETSTPGEYYGPAFISGAYPNFLRTPAVNPLLLPAGLTNDGEGMKALNLAGKTDIIFTAGSTYHIYAELNFETQKVDKLIVTEVGNETNTQTIEDKPFMNNEWRNWDGARRTDVADTTVNDIAVISSVQTRRSQNPTMETRFDNLEIYTLTNDMGQANVVVRYIDQNDQTIKERTVENLNIGQVCELDVDDKKSFSENGFYYAYDTEGTAAKNTGGYADGVSVTVAQGAVLYVKYFKTAVAAGNYVWTGATNRYWSELDANFTVNGTGPIPYQPGNPVIFSADAAANDTVFVKGVIQLGESNVEVTGNGYTFVNDATGINNLVGTGQFIVNDAEASIGFDNQLAELVVSGTKPLTLIARTSGVHAQKIRFTTDNSCLRLRAVTAVPIAYDSIISAGTLNLELLSNNGCGSAFINVPTLNVKLGVPGRKPSASWTTAFDPYLNDVRVPYDNMKINVSNICESYTQSVAVPATDEEGNVILNEEGNITYVYKDSIFVNPIVGFGLQDVVAANASVHLGDNVRLVRTYNEGTGGSTLQVGELTGTENSYLHLGWIGGRSGSIQVGGLNTDHEFKGKIEKFYEFFSPDAKIDSRAALVKVGTGKWSLSQDQIIDNGITVNGGELELLGDISIGIGTVTVNNGGTLTVGGEFGILYGYDAAGAALESIVTTTTVNQGGALKTLRGSQINSLKTTIGPGGSLTGGFNGIYDLAMDASVLTEGSEIPAAIWKPTVSSFNDGDFDKLYSSEGGFEIFGDINITVNSSGEGDKITLLESGASAYTVLPEIIRVNGEEIPQVDIANGGEVPAGAKYAWLFDADFGSYELSSLTTYSGINEINVNKEVKSVQYYDLLGRGVSKNTGGFLVLKTTYTDNTTSIKKVYIYKH
jgi:hypothetical protein